MVILRYSGSIGFLVEFICENMSISKNLISAIICRMKKNGVKEIQFMSHDKKLVSYFKSIGFIKYRRLIDIIYCSNNESFLNLLTNNTLFEYTLIDSDENI